MFAFVPPAPLSPPTTSVAVLTMIALVSAGEGTAAPALSSRSYQSRISAANPVASGAACEVPETSE